MLRQNSNWNYCKGWSTSRHSITNWQHLRSLEKNKKDGFDKIYFVYILLLQGFENSNARALVVKGINVLLTLLQVSHATLIWNIDEDNVHDTLEQKGMSKI